MLHHAILCLYQINLTLPNSCLSQEYSVRTTQLALCQVVCDQLSIPQVSMHVNCRTAFSYSQEKLLIYIFLQPDLESGLVFTGVRGGPTRLQQPLRPIPTKYNCLLKILFAMFLFNVEGILQNKYTFILLEIFHGSFHLPGDQHECQDSCLQTGWL